MMLNYITLQNELFMTFEAMNSVYNNGDEYMATRIANAITNYIYSGTITTVDTAKTIDNDDYVGKGVGKMMINEIYLRNGLLNVFVSKNNDFELARRIAYEIDTVCTVNNTCSIVTQGYTIQEPSIPYYGNGIGNFRSSNNIIFSRLKNCYDAMKHMSLNGNMYLAQEWALGVDEYLKFGTVSVDINLAIPISGTGNGSGKIS